MLGVMHTSIQHRDTCIKHQNVGFTPTLQKSRMLQIQDVRGYSCSVLPQTIGNAGYAVNSGFPQGKKHANFIKMLEFTWGRSQIFAPNSSEVVRRLSFKPLWHVYYATKGFTLLEILIAIFIFSVLVTTLFGSFRTMLSGTRGIDSGVATYEMARNCLSRMRADLKSTYVALPPAYATPDVSESSDPYRFKGSLSQTESVPFPTLRFTSLAHIDFAKKTNAGIVEIVYYVESENGNEFILRRADNPYPYPEFEVRKSDPILCREIRSLKFKYFNREGEEFEEWDSDSDTVKYMTPEAVGIILVIGPESDAVIFESTVSIPVYR